MKQILIGYLVNNNTNFSAWEYKGYVSEWEVKKGSLHAVVKAGNELHVAKIIGIGTICDNTTFDKAIKVFELGEGYEVIQQ